MTEILIGGGERRREFVCVSAKVVRGRSVYVCVK